MLIQNVLLISSIVYFLLGVVLQIYKEPNQENIWIRLALFLSVVIFYRFYDSANAAVRRLAVQLTYTYFAILTAHSIYVTRINDYSPAFIFQDFFCLIAFSIVTVRLYYMFGFLIFFVVTMLGAGYNKLGKEDFIILIYLVSASAAFIGFIQFIKIFRLNKIVVDAGDIDNFLSRRDEGIVFTDAETRVLYLNSFAEKLMGEKASLLINSKLNLRVPRENILNSTEARVQGFDNRVLKIKYTKVYVDEEPGYMITIHDITELAEQERLLNEKNKLFDSVMSSSEQATLVVDTKGNIEYLNPFAEKLLERQLGSVKGKNFHEEFHPKKSDGTESDPETFPAYLAYIDSHPYHISSDVFWKNEHEFVPVEYISVPLFENEKPRGAVIYFRDITRRKAQEEIQNNYNKEILFLSGSAMKFLEIQRESAVFRFTGEEGSKIVKGGAIIINSFDPVHAKLKTVHVVGMERANETKKMIQREWKELEYFLEPDSESWNLNFGSGEIIHPDGLYSLKFAGWNRKLCATLEKEIQTRKIYCFALRYEEELYGNAIVLSPEKEETSSALLEVFFQQAGIALHRRRSEKRDLEFLFREDSLIKSTDLPVFECGLNGKILYGNDSFLKLFGWEEERLLDKNLFKNILWDKSYGDIESIILELQKERVKKLKLDITKSDGQDAYYFAELFLKEDPENAGKKISGILRPV